MGSRPRLTRHTAPRWGMSGSALGDLFGVAGTGFLGPQVATPDPIAATPAGHDCGRDTGAPSPSVAVAVLEELSFDGPLRIRAGDDEELIVAPLASSVRVNGSITSCDSSPWPF